MAVLGLRFCARAFSSCGKRGALFIAVHGPLTIVASLVAEHRLQSHRLSNCGSRAPLLRGMWDLPRPGLEPTSPALAGRLSTTAPPGKPLYPLFFRFFSHIGHDRALSRVPCAIQQVLISYLFYIQQHVYVNPNLPIYPSPPSQMLLKQIPRLHSPSV